MTKKISSETENCSIDHNSGFDPQQTDRGLSRVPSRRTIIRANSTDKIENVQVKRAASTAGLMKNQPTIAKV
jgi:hypothetical protein